uniref:flagellar hook-associated protein FlgK n=1 Tax=Agathobacter sp. TaxID=2021311 RepID=UPI0040562DA1
MANGFGGLYIGTSGLQSAQNALNTTANNLANVNTTGYVRQQVVFTDAKYDKLKLETKKTSVQQSGLGVSIGDVVHARDIFLDKAYRLENGRMAFYESCYEVNTYVEDLFQELDGEQFKQSVEDLWVAFQELAKAPADSVNQNLVVQKAELIISRTQTLYGDLQSYQSNLNAQIIDEVDAVNEIGDRIFELNLEIQKVEANGKETAMTARDERDALLDELSAYTNIDVMEDARGFVTVTIDGVEFVTESKCQHMDVYQEEKTGFATPCWPQLSDYEKEQYVQVYKTDGIISAEANTDIGSIKAKLILRGREYGTYDDLLTMEAYEKVDDCVVMETQAQIDLLFHEIITTMNDIFCPNIALTEDVTDANGNVILSASDDILILDTENCAVGEDGKLPPKELFERMGMERYTEYTGYVNGEEKTYYVYNKEDLGDTNSIYGVGNIQVNEEIVKQVTLLPAFTQNGAVDMKLGERLAEAWNVQGMQINPKDQYPCTFQGFYDKMISELGTAGNTYFAATETMANTVTSIENKRAQIMGVSSDEELTKMIKYQSAYNAASRYITVVSQMTETIVTGLI